MEYLFLAATSIAIGYVFFSLKPDTETYNKHKLTDNKGEELKEVRFSAEEAISSLKRKAPKLSGDLGQYLENSIHFYRYWENFFYERLYLYGYVYQNKNTPESPLFDSLMILSTSEAMKVEIFISYRVSSLGHKKLRYDCIMNRIQKKIREEREIQMSNYIANQIESLNIEKYGIKGDFISKIKTEA